MKKTPLKPGRKSLQSRSKLKSYSTLKHTSVLQKGTSVLKKNSELKKQSDASRDKWEKARSECVKKYNGKCAICGKPGTQVHHIHLRSKRKDLIYNQNNLILLCDKHHFHHGSDRYEEQTRLIALKFNVSVEELLKLAEKE